MSPGAERFIHKAVLADGFHTNEFQSPGSLSRILQWSEMMNLTYRGGLGGGVNAVDVCSLKVGALMIR